MIETHSLPKLHNALLKRELRKPNICTSLKHNGRDDSIFMTFTAIVKLCVIVA